MEGENKLSEKSLLEIQVLCYKAYSHRDRLQAELQFMNNSIAQFEAEIEKKEKALIADFNEAKKPIENITKKPIKEAQK